LVTRYDDESNTLDTPPEEALEEAPQPMADVEFMHLCDYAFQAEGGKACIIGIFDGIGAHVFPATHMLMTIAVKFQGQAHEIAPVKIEVVRPNSESLAAVEGQIGLGPDGGAFIDFKLMNLQFPEPGRYSVRVTSEGRILASQPLHLTAVKAPGAPSVPGVPGVPGVPSVPGKSGPTSLH
jgi:hypothetical protein